MLKKRYVILILIPLILSLAACASSTSAGTSSNAATTPQPGQGFDMSRQPVEQKLALGTLSLEGTDKAITAEQAKQLLPLWKAVKSMGNSSITSTEEVSALYKQIKETMAADQVQVITALNLSQTDLQALMKKYSVQAPQGGRPPQNSTRTAGSQSSGMGGPGGGSGGPPLGDMGGIPGAGQSNSSGSTSAPRPAAPPPGGGIRNGMNYMFLDSLIKLLQQRAGA